MIRNYFKIAVRSLLKNRRTAFINVLGLTIGLSSCLLILAYVLHETSYDRFTSKADRTFRITRDFLDDAGTPTFQLNSVAPPIPMYMREDFKEIEQMTVLLMQGSTSLKYGEKLFSEDRAAFADEQFFDVFEVPVLAGNPRQGLAEPFSVMMTEAVAAKYFGREDPMGKTVRLGGQYDCKVTGIYQELPGKAHLHPNILVSFCTLRNPDIYGVEQLRTNWGNNAFLTYVVLPDAASGMRLQAQLPAFLDRHQPTGGTDFVPSKGSRLNVQPVTDIHLRSHLDDEVEPPGDITRVYVFTVIAVFILLIACINYMNLSTARATLRAKEIGVRKVIGAGQSEIIVQFLSESVLLAFVSLVLALGVTFFALPWMGRLAGLPLSIQELMRWEVLAGLLLTPLLVGVLAGLYPALYLSAFKPNRILKGLFKAGGGTLSSRQALVVVQFSISIILTIATGVIFQQLSYVRTMPLGLAKEQVIVMPYQSNLTAGYDAFRNSMLGIGTVKDLTRSSRIPSGRLLDGMGATVQASDGFEGVSTPIKYVAVDNDFVPTYDLTMAAGRNFSREFLTDTNGFILNEAAVRMIGWKTPEKAIGKNISYGPLNGKVIGVLKDFHFESAHQRIAPIVFLLGNGEGAIRGFGNLSLKMDGADIAGTLNRVEKAWKSAFPELPFTYTFLDARFQRLYQSEQRQGKVFVLFSSIAVFVACLGLLGLSAFAITLRVKEIGIRKVLGASVSSITALLSRDFLRLVVIAMLIAFPVAWYTMRIWLEGFAYRIGLPWWVFVASGLVTLLIALLTVASQTVSVATANPIKSLRTE